MHFLIVSHTVPTSATWGLDDLAGSAGRVDVLCRAITNALFVSHGMHDNVVTLQFQQDPATAMRIHGSKVNRLNPDERSTAARIKKALLARHEDPWWEEVEAGIEVAPFTLEETLDDIGDVIVLDATGEPATRPVPNGCYVLSDHEPFARAERDALAKHETGSLSLGPQWLHGHQCITIINWLSQ